MRILVTGATGFLGGHLTRRLLKDAMPVRILARDASTAQPLVERGAELIIGTVNDRVTLQRALDGVTTVYHLAGKLFIPGVPASDYFATHVEGTRLLLSCCAQTATITRFVHCSTTGVLGATGSQPADETAPYQPTNAYETSKMEGEKLVSERMMQGFPSVIVRPGLVYGPGDLHLLGFFRAIERGRFRPIGRAPIWMHPIYIDDMIEAFVRCGHDERAVGECFHIAGRESVTLAAFATAIADAFGVAPARGHIPLAVASAIAMAGDLLPVSLRPSAPLTRSRLDFLTHSRRYDIAKAHCVLDFTAATELPEGIARTIAWYRREGHLSTRRAA